MTTQYSHCSKGYLWHFYNSNFFPCLLVHCCFLELRQDRGGWSRAWFLSAFLKQAPGPLLVQRAFASFPERAIALLSKECKALLGIPVRFITLEGSEGELRLAHRGAGIDHTQSPGGAAQLGLRCRSAIDQGQKRESGGLNLPNRQVWNAIKQYKFALDIRDPRDYFSRENKSQAFRKEWNDSVKGSIMSLQAGTFPPFFSSFSQFSDIRCVCLFKKNFFHFSEQN